MYIRQLFTILKKRAVLSVVVLVSLKTTSSSTGQTRSRVHWFTSQYYSLLCLGILLQGTWGIWTIRFSPTLSHSDPIVAGRRSLNPNTEISKATTCFCWTGSTECWPRWVSGKRRRRSCSLASIMPARPPCSICWKTRFAFFQIMLRIKLLIFTLIICYSTKLKPWLYKQYMLLVYLFILKHF